MTTAPQRRTEHRRPRRATRAAEADDGALVVYTLHGRLPASRREGAARPLIRAAGLALAALLLCAAPALAQQQIDPTVPTNIPPEDLHDFKGFLDQVMDDIMTANGPTILAAGNTLWRGLAAIVVVWTGIKIAMSGTFSMWALIELVIGLWIPWVMLLFYATPIPGVGFTFPGMIAGGGNWLHSFFISDIVTAVQIELANLVQVHTTALSDAWAGTSWFELYTAFGDVLSTLLVGTSMLFLIFLCLVVIYAVTYAQVIWAQMAILILTFVGPMMIPWLVFEPMAFLFWGWFRSMITFALYGAIAGANPARVHERVPRVSDDPPHDGRRGKPRADGELVAHPLAVDGGRRHRVAQSGRAGRDAGERRRRRRRGHDRRAHDRRDRRQGHARRQSRRRGRGEMMSQTEQDSGKTYADIWGEAVHSNRHLRVLSMALAGLVLLLVVIIIRLSSVELPKPIVVRVDEVGRAEALAYEAVEAQADPLDPTTKYFLNRFIDDYYSRRAATVETAWPRSLRFLTSTLANEAFRLEGENVAMLAAGAARDELQVERVVLRIQASPDPPHAAAADFDLVRLVNGAEVGRDRWTLSLQFTFLETVDPELMIVNPMGLLITYLRGDRALVTR